MAEFIIEGGTFVELACTSSALLDSRDGVDIRPPEGRHTVLGPPSLDSGKSSVLGYDTDERPLAVLGVLVRLLPTILIVTQRLDSCRALRGPGR